ncbi:uncharacterized protein LOC126992013 isoform X2 [Eriocheir sinensis]|uniref:uncharacterized protein LOC126992013 isoform X2 n=1 Tax=Eriocheir sinensis TaxID=95602 RepID=UPI0021C6E4B8|nr:uncharacterized protein LOC126992013 isoform X2 [Eriocheir sinensis]
MDSAAPLSKMKVAELKKELRAHGLSTVGNKTELLERLQEAIDGGDTLGQDLSEGGVEVEEGDFCEEDILGEEELDSELTPQEEEAALKGAAIRVKDDSSLLEPEPEKKKISLKRTQPTLIAPPDPPSTAPATTPTPAATPQEATPAPEGGAEAVEGEEGAGEGAAVSEGGEEATSPVPKKIIKLDGGGENKDLKARAERFGIPLTDEARKEARKARFGINSSNGTEASKSEEEKKAARAARFGGAAGGGGGGGGGKISMEGEKVEIDQLMKRAARFGEVTSPALLKATEEEKKKQRMERFSAGATATADEGKKTEGVVAAPADDALKKRKDRFGIVDEEEKKKKRAERFAI